MEQPEHGQIPRFDSRVLGRFNGEAHPRLAALNAELDRLGANHGGPAANPGTYSVQEIGGDPYYLSVRLTGVARDLSAEGEFDHALTVLDEGVRWGLQYGETGVSGAYYADLAVAAALAGQPNFAVGLMLDKDRFRELPGRPREDESPAPQHAAGRADWWLSQVSYVWRSLRRAEAPTPNMEHRLRQRVTDTIESLAAESGQTLVSVADSLANTADNFERLGETAWAQELAAIPQVAAARAAGNR